MRLVPACCTLALFLAACTPLPGVESSPPLTVRELSGVLSGATVLAGEILLVGDLLVPEGSSLQIEAGTVVRVRPAESTKIDPEYLSPATEILVRGTLRVAGSERQPVRFLPERTPEDGASAWAGILFDGGSGEVTGAVIEGAETGIACIGASPTIRGSIIRGSRYGVVAQHQSSPRLLDNAITGGEGGVFCWFGAAPYLQGNRITDNAEEGLFVDADSRPRLEGNIVSGNAIGLALAPRDLSYASNEVRDNGENVRLLARRGLP